MSAKANKTLNTLVVLVVMIFAGIILANGWVASEMEQTQAITTPASPISTITAQKQVARSTDFADLEVSENLETSDVSQPTQSKTKRKKRQKIIYEIPLDDVNLVQ